MKGKRGLAVWMSLVVMFTLLACLAVPVPAASPSAPNPALCLTKDDFYFGNRAGERAAYSGYPNYLDWHDHNQGKSTNRQFSTWTHCQDPLGRSASMMAAGVFCHEEVYLTCRPGVAWGSTEDQVQSVYGKVRVYRYGAEDSLSIGRYDSNNRPVEYCVYGMRRNGWLYVQVFSFNAQKQLCKITWDSQQSSLTQ